MTITSFDSLYLKDPSKFYIEEIAILDLFCSCNLDLNPITFIYELDPYSMKTYRMCKYELPMSRLSKVV